MWHQKNYRIVSYVIDVAAFKLFQHQVIGAAFPTVCFVHDLLMGTICWKGSTVTNTLAN